MKLDKRTEWVFPAGKYQARIASAFLHRKGAEEVLKIILEPVALVHPLKEFKVRALYWPQDLERFVNEFTPILGEEKVATLFTLDGELISCGLGCLDDLIVDMETELETRTSHKTPLNKVIQLKPRGELVPEVDKAA